MQWLTEETGWILPEESGPWTDAGLGSGEAFSPASLLRLGTGLAGAAVRCMIGTAPGSDFARAAALTVAGAAAAATNAETIKSNDVETNEWFRCCFKW